MLLSGCNQPGAVGLGDGFAAGPYVQTFATSDRYAAYLGIEVDDALEISEQTEI